MVSRGERRATRGLFEFAHPGPLSPARHRIQGACWPGRGPGVTLCNINFHWLAQLVWWWWLAQLCNVHTIV